MALEACVIASICIKFTYTVYTYYLLNVLWTLPYSLLLMSGCQCRMLVSGFRIVSYGQAVSMTIGL